MDESNIKKVICKKYSDGKIETIDDFLIQEYFYNVRIGTTQYRSLTIDTPDKRYLGTGYIYLSTELEPEYIVQNTVFSDGGCSIPGESFEIFSGKTDRSVKSVTPFEGELGASAVPELTSQFIEQSKVFEKTGAVHGALFFTNNDFKTKFFYDIARHNCIIKGAGFIMEEKSFSKCGVFLSCRLNSEIIALLARIGITLVITRAAPTYDAVHLAERIGMTLAGFARENRFTLFTGQSCKLQ